MSDKQLNWKFAEEFVVEGEHAALARQHSLELGVEAVTPSIGAQLALIAAASRAETIVEIGTGVGVSSHWLLSGAPNAELTSIDTEIDYQQLARKTLLEAGHSAKQLRLIAGTAAEVLPRLNEGSYNLVFVDADPASVIEYVEHGLRLVKRGGTVLVAHALWRDRVADPAQRDDTVANFRLLLREIAKSEAVLSALSPAGDGLLQLTRISD